MSNPADGYPSGRPEDPHGDPYYGGPQYGGGEQFGNPQYGAGPYGGQPYGAQQYGAQPFGGQPYGTQPFGAEQYGAMQPYAQQYGGMQPYGYPPATRKDPALMLIASLILPGLGTILNGATGKGIGIMVGYFIGALLSVILIGLPIMFGFWVWGMYDAYQGAKDHNARHGLP